MACNIEYFQNCIILFEEYIVAHPVIALSPSNYSSGVMYKEKIMGI